MLPSCMGRRLLSFCLLSLPLTLLAAEAQTPAAWLEKMSAAARSLNYHGTFVYQHGDQLETMRIIHKADESGEYERLVSLNGEASEVVRNNDVVLCILADNRKMVVEKEGKDWRSLHLSLSDKLPELQRHYQLKLLGDDRVAGREAKVVSITPKDEFRYGHRLWLDRDSGLLLKSVVLDARQQAVEQIMFTQLELLEFVPDELVRSAWPDHVSRQAKKSRRLAHEPARDNRWRVVEMPAGFRELEHRLSENGNTKHHLVLSDGLATVSVFIENAGDDSGDITDSGGGGINAYSARVNEYRVTAVGEVPTATVKLIASSTRLTQQ